MDYTMLRKLAKDGDVLMLEGKGLVSLLIRMATGQQVSHVAMLAWIDGGLWVAEMQEFRGYRLTPASTRVPELCKAGHVYFGQAGINSPAILQAAKQYRGARYSYWTLATVWLAQVFRFRAPAKLICSTFVQRCWEAAGKRFTQTADPGDFMRLCVRNHPVRCGHG